MAEPDDVRRLVDADELEELIADAWRGQAPRALVPGFDQRQRA